MDADVAVVGGSVAGCATALHLARAGHSVVVLDAAEFPREKVCGEGLLPHGVAELERLSLLGEVEATGAVAFDGIAYVAGDLTAIGRFPVGHGLGVRRLRFDPVLRAATSAVPLVAMRKATVTRTEVTSEAVQVTLRDGSLRVRALVGADGLHSSVRRWSGLRTRSPGRHRYGLRVHYRLPRGRPNVARVEVHLTDRGEFYLTPVAPDELNVAVLLEKSQTRGLNSVEAAAALLRGCDAVHRHVEGAEVLSEPRVVGPLRQVARSLVAPRTLLVGDAAGFVDAITGEGMSIALVSARLAAGVLHEALVAGDLSVRSLSAYSDLHRRHAADPSLLTRLMVAGIRHRALSRRVVRGLMRHPDLFDRILAVNCGQVPLRSVLPSAWRLLC